jgi:hypothetical protein
MPAFPRRGFVVAMRAKIIFAAPLPAQFEWVIVSRWGTEGEYLALGWTLLPAPSDKPPMLLSPRRTSLARAIGESVTDSRTNFLLASSLPDNGVTVAGDFIPAKGYVRLVGVGSDLSLVSKGKSLRPDLHPSWQVQAARAFWFGEFIESSRG